MQWDLQAYGKWLKGQGHNFVGSAQSTIVSHTTWAWEQASSSSNNSDKDSVSWEGKCGLSVKRLVTKSKDLSSLDSWLQPFLQKINQKAETLAGGQGGAGVRAARAIVLDENGSHGCHGTPIGGRIMVPCSQPEAHPKQVVIMLIGRWARVRGRDETIRRVPRVRGGEFLPRTVRDKYSIAPRIPPSPLGCFGGKITRIGRIRRIGRIGKKNLCIFVEFQGF